MKVWIALFALCLGANAQAADTAEAMPGMPASYDRTENMQLIQSSPAMEANSLVAPVSSDANTIAAPISASEAQIAVPATRGSLRNRVPSEDTTLADISIATVSTVDRLEAYASDMYGTRIMSENQMNVSLYSFRLTQGLTDESALFVDAGFLKSTMDIAGSSLGNRQGMRDFEFGYIGRSPMARSAWIYGASMSGSPESISNANLNATGGGFSGSTLFKAHGGYERSLKKATGGVQLAYQYENGRRNNAFFDGQFRGIGDMVGDLTAYYEFPIAKHVGFGVAGGLAADGNPFGYATKSYHASAYSGFEVMDDMQVRLEAEGATTSYNSQDSGNSTRFTGVLSKAL